MRRKKLAIYISLIAVLTLILTILPVQAIYGFEQFEYDEDKHEVPCGSNRHYVQFNVDDNERHRYVLNRHRNEPPGWKGDSRFYAIEWKNKEGSRWYKTFDGAGSFNHCGYIVSYHSYHDVSIREAADPGSMNIVWIRFYYTGKVKDCEDGEEAARPMPLTCSNVWINEANNFEFIFLYEYADNNWVKIYDMAGVEVFSIDMPHGAASFEAALPDGTYTVKTFHEAGHIIQEFIIGKP